MSVAVGEARREIDAAEQSMRQRLRCEREPSPPGCRVAIRYRNVPGHCACVSVEEVVN